MTGFTRRFALGSLAGLGGVVVVLSGATVASLAPLPEALPPGNGEAVETQILDRSGRPLSRTYQNEWNVHDRASLREIPELLKRAFVRAEDKRFYRHGGADWIARLHAAVQNVRSLRAVRGASTITEQVVRILHPRERRLWSRWVEGFDAARLESRFGKRAILEFYLNQVPYARNRRGVRQAARDYFDRDLDTLTVKETLALAVLVRSPSRLDLQKSTEPIEEPIERLARALHDDGVLTGEELARTGTEKLRVTEAKLDVDAAHFLGHLPERARGTRSGARRDVWTTLDASLQSRAQRLLDRQIETLADRGVTDGALLVVDHESDEILAWVNGGGFRQAEGGQIDMVVTPRQPGSTLKPFVYALALEKGWTAATILIDEPIAEPVGSGLHSFRNYSRHYYGPLRLREALGNSLNVPAVKAVQFTGRAELFELLGELGVTSLKQHPDFYGDGLALGNGEITLEELVSAYSVLARGGVYRPLRWTLDEPRVREPRRVLTPEASSIIADILSDPEARALEFGRGSVLNLPRPTAVKTGTSNDYRDAWVVGFDSRYTVGVWMGNLDRKPMLTVTGSLGPAIVLRAIFAELHRQEDSRPLYLSRRLRRVPICRESGKLPTDACPLTSEWFLRDAVPEQSCPLHGGSTREAAIVADAKAIRIAKPSPGLHLALDPRIPDELERFELSLSTLPPGARVEWWIDGELFSDNTADRGRVLWPPKRGHHVAKARVFVTEHEPTWTDPIGFLVR